jgi:4-alpha-glucanotransferase
LTDGPLNRLADTVGIEDRYWDVQGHLHERSPETACLLLAALDIPARTEAEIDGSLATLAEAPWREILPPVIVAAHGREIELPLRCAASTMQSIGWSIDLEEGGQVTGMFGLQAIPVEATGEVDGTSVALRRVTLPAQPPGYHRLRLESPHPASAILIVTPERCYLPAEFPARRYWGVAAQLYQVRSGNNWGIGDFGDLAVIAEWTAAAGADVVGVNPLHALFLDSPQDASPYSPNSRLFLNPLYLDVASIPDFAESTEARSLAESPAIADAIRTARLSDAVDYAGIAKAKLAVLEQLHQHFLAAHASVDEGRGRAFRQFVESRGSDLLRFATFQVLTEHLGTHEWARWPAPFRDPGSEAVTRLIRGREERLSFFHYLQWQCDLQLSAAADRARGAGMTLGLYTDLAVSVDASSADHWANQGMFVHDARVGAPPDPFNEAGQEWGLVPLDPSRLRATGYAHFIALLRATMRHAGALRIDHIMGWQHLFLVPVGHTPAEGAYMRFPLEDLLGIAALESQRNQCVVIGEDLGTVPAGFRERMAAANVLSSRILYFEHEQDRFRRPAEYPPLALVSAATHDLATLRGYWTSDDITTKARLGIITTAAAEEQALAERERDKNMLLKALADEGLLPSGIEAVDAQIDAQIDAQHVTWVPELSSAINRYLARTPSLLLAVQLDDVAGERQQANLPGSTVQYPNWRRRLTHSLEELRADDRLRTDMTRISDERLSRAGATPRPAGSIGG